MTTKDDKLRAVVAKYNATSMMLAQKMLDAAKPFYAALTLAGEKK